MKQSQLRQKSSKRIGKNIGAELPNFPGVHTGSRPSAYIKSEQNSSTLS